MPLSAPQPDGRLADTVAQALGVPAVRLEVHPGGGSRAAYRVQIAGEDHATAFLRLDDGNSGMSGTEFDLRREADLLRRIRSLGLPVPEVLATIDDPPATVMELVPGTERLDRETAEAVGEELMGLVARIHAVDTAGLPFDRPATTTEAVDADLAWWTARVTATDLQDVPLVRLAGRVLATTRPDVPAPPGLVHGDLGPGNFLVHERRVSAILDWEMAHVGDPHEDLAWLWIRGAHSELGDPQRRFAEYERAAGRPVDHARLDWHVAFVTYKTVVALRAGLGRPGGGGRLVLVQHVLCTVYEALLGSALARLCGTALPLLEETPEASVTATARLVGRLSELTPRDDREVGIILDHLHAAASHCDWERRRHHEDLRSELGLAPDEVLAAIDSTDPAELAPLVRAVGRSADRACHALPAAVRRVRRAQAIGLGL